MATQAPPNSKPNRQYGAEVIWPSRPMERRPSVTAPITCRECRGVMSDGLLCHEDYCRHHPVNQRIDPAELRERERQQAATVREAAKRQDVQLSVSVQPLGCGHGTFSVAVDNLPPVHVRFLTGKCPACGSDEFPRLCKVVREAA